MAKPNRINIQQVAEYSGLSMRTVYRAIYRSPDEEGHLPSVLNRARKRMVNYIDFIEWLGRDPLDAPQDLENEKRRKR